MINKLVPTGYHICFRTRASKVNLYQMQREIDPEALLLAAERYTIVLILAKDETDQIIEALRLVLVEGNTMAEACRLSNLRQYQFSRAISRIAKRAQSMEGAI